MYIFRMPRTSGQDSVVLENSEDDLREGIVVANVSIVDRADGETEAQRGMMLNPKFCPYRPGTNLPAL